MADSPFIIEVNQSNFAEVVLQGSQQRPVLVDFWADWCQPCQALMPILAKLAEEYGGQFILAKVNSDQNQELSAQFGVRSLPTVKLFKNGAPVDEFMGALPEGEIRGFLDKHMERESDSIHAQALQTYQAGDTAGALELLKKANEIEPGRAKIVLDLAGMLAQQGETDDAEALLKSLPDDERDKPEVASLLARLEFSRESAGLGDIDELESKAAEGDLQATYDLAMSLIGNNQYEPAMQHLLNIMKKDRTFKEDIGRTTLLKVFDMMGDHPLVAQYRRQMFNYLY